MQTRIDRIVRDDVNFDNGYTSVADYFLRYLLLRQHPGITAEMQVDKKNARRFASAYVEEPYRKVVQNQVSLNKEGWAKLLRSGKVRVHNGIVKITRK